MFVLDSATSAGTRQSSNHPARVPVNAPKQRSPSPRLQRVREG
jgi:hypothetical protein